MKWSLQAFCAHKGPIFSLKPTYHAFGTDFEWKFADNLAELYNIQQKVMRYYRILKCNIVVTECHGNKQFWIKDNNKFRVPFPVSAGMVLVN